ncbi:MAG: hypothetical protein AAF311_13155 [Pseudomonadota bacterium]
MDFAEFNVSFTDEPGITHKVWLFPIVLGHSPLSGHCFAMPYRAKIERRVSHDGMISVDGNSYSVPDTTRRRVVEVQNHTDEVRLFEEGVLIARHPVLEGKNQRWIDPAHRKAPPARQLTPRAPGVLLRPLSFYDAVGKCLAAEGARF